MILQHLQRIKLQPLSFMRFSSDKEKEGKEEKIKRIEQKLRRQIQGNYKHRSAMLYDRYMESRKKALLSLDDYQLYFTLIVERMPIYMPYKQKKFEYYKTMYNYRQKTGYKVKIPKQLLYDMEEPTYNRSHPDNKITHRIKRSQIDVQDYHQNSRNWKLVDPNVIDSHSIQTYSSDGVFFIVKDENGKWRFPRRPFLQKETPNESFLNFSHELFNGSKEPKLHISKKKPALITNNQDGTLDRGKGIRQLHYRAITISGFPSMPNPLFTDYAWVPKPLLSNYFEDDYFNKVIRTAIYTQ